ncbi:Hypp6844 [Branchiostoma lanceolatum]|uniref:Hypp6844 protein n=1 Tax=Branchiostoma lanceolatum TaxID=7740 RepID=A0A8K0E5Q9_BRALA|nr:Hypp6844 [Branchiostoma lanceolatum]
MFIYKTTTVQVVAAAVQVTAMQVAVMQRRTPRVVHLCQVEGTDYVPYRQPITNPGAEKKLLDFLHKTVVYKKAENYIHSKDTHYVESFNNAMLVYHDKRICFGRTNYLLWVNLAILDWNDYADREITSVWFDENAANTRKQQPKKQLVRKAYKLRKDVWRLFAQKALYQGTGREASCREWARPASRGPSR